MISHLDVGAAQYNDGRDTSTFLSTTAGGDRMVDNIAGLTHAERYFSSEPISDDSLPVLVPFKLMCDRLHCAIVGFTSITLGDI